MAKFNTVTAARPAVKAPTATTGPARTHEGGRGATTELITSLFLLMSSDFAGEPTFYESPSDRLARLQSLVQAATITDPATVGAMIPWIRTDANMRSVAVVAACEYANALPHTEAPAGTYPTARRVIDGVCQRPDEPAEILGYWWRFHGRKLPMAVKRGLADAAARLYTERAVIKYNSPNKPIRFQDVIVLTHPTPRAGWQSALFKYLLDDRYQDDGPRSLLSLGDLETIEKAMYMEGIPRDKRRDWFDKIDASVLADAGYTWERLAGWLPGGMDAEAWQKIIPNMGVMALVRNLRNFEQAKISREAADIVRDRITDPDAITRSRMLPFRFWSAYKHSGTIKFADALETALEIVMNTPRLRGRTLVMVDISGSMTHPMSGKSKVEMWEAGAVFAAALRGNGVDLWAYATGTRRVASEVSALRTIDNIKTMAQRAVLEHGTQTWPSVQRAYDGHDRVLVFTDSQDHPSRVDDRVVPANVPVYVWDLRGYHTTNINVGANRHLLGGLSDRSFALIDMLERGRDAGWPWDQ